MAKEMTTGKSERKMKIELDGIMEEDEAKLATAFNEFFVAKISALRDRIDPKMMSDPLDKMDQTQSSFSFHPVEEEDILKIIRSFPPKRTTGSDSIPMTVIKDAAEVLTVPLTRLSLIHI